LLRHTLLQYSKDAVGAAKNLEASKPEPMGFVLVPQLSNPSRSSKTSEIMEWRRLIARPRPYFFYCFKNGPWRK
jgi:hypothetical protein